jgi:hypothetical protein
MKTPLKPSLDDEIYEVEQRLTRRRAEIPRVARAAGRSALDKVASPAGLAVAVAVGFIAGGGLRRGGARLPERRKEERRQDTQKKKGIAVGSLLMSGAVALIRAQYGSPFGMAQALLGKLQSPKTRQSPPGDTSGPKADIRPARRVAG